MKKDDMETEEKYDLAKWLAGEMDEAELTAFKNSPEFNQYDQIATMSRDFKTEDFDENAMLAKVMSGEKRRETKVIRLYDSMLFKVAAVLMVALGLFFVFKDGSTVTSAQAGMTASVVLPDDSKVELNSGSEVLFDKSSWNEHRQLTLKGEAYFKVAKGKVFDVNTDLGKVTVVGTQFNVKARNKRFEVECYEGKVKVTANGKEQFLTPGMMLIFENGLPKGAPTVVNSAPVWTKGDIRFVSTSVAEVVKEFERKFDVRIELKSEIEETVTGTFSGADLNLAIEKLCAVYKLNAKTENNVVILSADE